MKLGFVGSGASAFPAGGFRGDGSRTNEPVCARVRYPAVTPVRMGLNAKNLKKKKGGGKKTAGGAGGGAGKKGKGGGAGGGGGNSAIDTQRREFIYQMYKLTKVLPNGKELLKSINLSFYPGAKIGILGKNGAGKSTLMKIMAGLDDQFEGESKPQDGIRIGYLSQEPQLDKGKTVQENIEWSVRETKALIEKYNEIGAKIGESPNDEEMEKLTTELARVQDSIEAANGWDLERMVDRALDALRCPDGSEQVDTLSGGERRRVALAQLLLRRPDLLLLDEPTNHLDALSVDWLEKFLETFPGTVVATTHDRYFLDNVAQWILEIDRGAGIPYEGNYSGWLEVKEKRLAQEKKDNKGRQRLLVQELEWMRQNPKGRQAKQKARISRFDELQSAEQQSLDAKVTSMNQIFIPPGPKLGDQVVEVNDVRKSFGDKMLVDNMSFTIPPGAIVGIVGPNGAGKSTLFKMIMGEQEPDAGEVKLGQTVRPMYVDQNRANLDGSKSVWETISDGNDTITLGTREVSSRAYLSWFNFRGVDQQKAIDNLSGGERNRLNLARVIKEPGNLLLLDEPTNDLDVDTLGQLEDAILAFSGSTMVISHDRCFLDRICTHILAFEGDSQTTFFTGNWHDYEVDRRSRTGESEPTRVKFRPIPSL